MEQYNVIVLMAKDKETGFLTETVDSYSVESNIDLIENAYLTEEEEGTFYIYLTLTTKDVEDWQYYGIYDLYDEGIFDGMDIEILDGSGEYNPRWIFKLKYSKERQEIEEKLNSLIKRHNAELERVLPLVDADKEKYTKESEEAVEEE